MKYRLCAAVLAVAFASGADAAVMVIGNANARMCYETLIWNGDLKRNLGYCQAALSEDNLDAKDRAATLVNRGIVFLKQRRLESSLADFDAALAIEPDLAEAYVNKGVAMVNAGNDDEAIRLLTRALELGTAKPEIAYYGRAVANELSGRDAQAYRDYRAAAEILPEWSEPRDQLKRFSVVKKGG
jgi:tetratricopeptide (TPR) repeat protein